MFTGSVERLSSEEYSFNGCRKTHRLLHALSKRMSIIAVNAKLHDPFLHLFSPKGWGKG